MLFFDMLDAAGISPVLVAGILGLLVGSFLNVVIYRLPVMMQRGWEAQSAELRGEPAPEQDTFNLMVPRSRCGNCGTPITALQNIPVVSWIFLRGRCASCGTEISIRYPAIEAITGLLSALTFWQLGPGIQASLALVLVWSLIALTMIDVDHYLLPDSLTLPLLWLGLLISLFPAADGSPLFVDTRAALWGAIAGYLSLWSIYWLFKLVTGKEGMGYGDFKLLAALGAWLGWEMLPLLILLSAVVGAVTGILMMVLGGRGRETPIPFGPYLAGAGFIALLWGQQITTLYLGQFSNGG